MLHVDWTINIANIIAGVCSTLAFCVMIGVYIGKLQAFIKKCESFFEESSSDRKIIHKEIEQKHVENKSRFAWISGKLATIESMMKRNGHWKVDH